jgi:hypothetical protein
MEEKMKMISRPNWRLTRSELTVVLPKIACELPNLAEGSIELNNAHANLLDVRRTLARPDFRAR